MCMTLIAGKNATLTGRVMVGHNEDDYVHAAVKHHFVPAKDWEDDVYLPAEEGLIRVKQARHTYAYYWMQVRGENGALTTADSFINENGVCVVSDSSCGSREDEEAGDAKYEGICYELRRIIAERAESARSGLNVAIEMMKTYGYASPGRMYTIADKNEAFMIQIVRGHRYMAARVPDDSIVVLPNHYTFHSLTDVPEMFYPEDIVSYAKQRGWYNPDTDGEFDFAAAYQNKRLIKHPVNLLRQKYATEKLLGRKFASAEEAEYCPFCVKAERKLGAEDFMAALSDHYEGTGDDMRFGPGASPHDTNVRRVCTGTTVESQVYDFAEEAFRTCVWTTFGRPCENIYLPLHLLCGAAEGLNVNCLDPFFEAENHHVKLQGQTEAIDDIWHRLQYTQNLIEFRYIGLISKVRALKKKYRAEYKELEKASGSLTKIQLHEADNRILKQADELIKDFTEKEVVNAKILNTGAFEEQNGKYSITVQFSFEQIPDECTVIFGPGRSQLNHAYAHAAEGTLLKIKDNVWQAVFVFDEMPLSKDGSGRYEFNLGGNTLDGGTFAAMTYINI